MEKDITLAIDILKESRDKVKELLPEGLALRSDNVLNQLINGLSHAAGVHPGGTSTKPAEFKPMTHFLGEKIKTPSDEPTTSAEPSQDDVTALSDEVNAAWPDFLTAEPKELKKKYSDLVIKAVAQKAGMEVSTTDKVSLDFIRTVKGAVAAKTENDKKKAPALPEVGNTEGGGAQDHVVTQEDLDANAGLRAKGVKVGDTIQVPTANSK